MKTTLINFFLLAHLFAVGNTAATKCNGLADLCDLRVNQVTFPGSHNAGSGFDGLLHYWSGGQAPSCSYRNHAKSFTDQFAFGVRYFDIDTCYGKTEALNCHCGSECAYAGSIEKGLLQIDSSMKKNPENIVFIHFNRDSQEDYREKIAKSIEATLIKLWSPNSLNKLSMSTYYHRNQKWPFLKDAIASNQRIFIFMDYHLFKHLPRHDWLVQSNHIIASSWDTNKVTSSCSTITTNAKAKCVSSNQFMELSAFGSYGLCTWDMASVCARWLGEARDACYAKREPQGKTVNFLLVDYLEYDWGGESVVNKALFMNQKTIKKYLGKDIFFPQLQGCSYHSGWAYNYCWKYCSGYGWCWINEYCGKNAGICKQKSFPCYSKCGYN